MTERHDNRLYELLPTIHRIRDQEQGQALEALLAVIGEELARLEQDVEGLYEDWFIETCREWVVAYIGDLLGVRGFHPGAPGVFSLRAFVANTLAYRRRKGTVAMLEQLSKDVTRWPTRVVEFAWQVSATQHVNHLRPRHHRGMALGDPEALDLLQTPFGTTPRTAEVRRIPSGRGRYNLPNIGFYLWRLTPYEVAAGELFAVDAAEGKFTFHPLGYPMHLFHRGLIESEIAEQAGEIHMPAPLRPRWLGERLKAGDPLSWAVYGERGSLCLYRQGDGEVEAEAEPVRPYELRVVDLADWGAAPEGCLLIDPVLGRLRGPGGGVERYRARYHYGFAADLGGGTYRREPLALLEQAGDDLATETVPVAGLADAVRGWLADHAGDEACKGRFLVEGNGLSEGWGPLQLPAGDCWLVIEAAERHQPNLVLPEALEVIVPGTGTVNLVLIGLRIQGGLAIRAAGGDGEALPAGGTPGMRLCLSHCTLVPGLALDTDGDPVAPDTPSLVVRPGLTNIEVTLERCISGPVQMPAGARGLIVRDSIVQHPGQQRRVAIGGPGAHQAPFDAAPAGAPLTLQRSTVLGQTRVLHIELADNALFHERVHAERAQVGCCRYSYIPPASRVPRRYRCLPDPSQPGRGYEKVRPEFTTVRYGHHDYARLASSCPAALRTGGEDGTEPGAYQMLREPHREANLRHALEEYLRFGQEAGLIHVT